MKHRPRQHLAFDTLRPEGALFLPDQLEKAALGAADFQTEVDYRTPKGLKLKDDISRGFQIASAQWKHFASQCERNDVDAAATTTLFVRELLRDAFGYADIAPIDGLSIGDQRYRITLQAGSVHDRLLPLPPHPPHIVWLGEGAPRDDKVPVPDEARALLAGEVVVEEKLDGANLGLSLSPDGSLRAQNRGQYLIAPHAGQFARLPAWLAQHEAGLRAVLTPDRILFGEWCAARHSLDYAALPDWFLLFDVYDRAADKFWSSARRNALAMQAGLATVPQVWRGHVTLDRLEGLVSDTPSRYRQGPLEGVVIRSESADWCEARAKLVRAQFTQAINDHWRRRAVEWNRMATDASVSA